MAGAAGRGGRGPSGGLAVVERSIVHAGEDGVADLLELRDLCIGEVVEDLGADVGDVARRGLLDALIAERGDGHELTAAVGGVGATLEPPCTGWNSP